MRAAANLANCSRGATAARILHCPTTSPALANTGLAPSNDAESAMLRTLPPSAYTALLMGANNSTGIGLIEIYNLGR